MKKFKKAMALSLALAMGLSLVACGDKKENDDDKTTEGTTTAAPNSDGDSSDDASTDKPSEDGTTAAPGGDTAGIAAPSTEGWDESKKIYAYSWDEDFQKKLKVVLEAYPEYEEYVEFISLGCSGTDGSYQTALDPTFDTDKYPSLIPADNDVAKYYSEDDTKTANLYDLGFTDEMLSVNYDFSKQYGTYNGQLKAVTWQVSTGSVFYRRDIAKEVLGSDDPETVQAALADWDKFFETADKLKEKGYYIVSGPSDVKYAIWDSQTQPWVTEDGDTAKLSLDGAVKEYLETAKKLSDGGYTNNTKAWDNTWNADMQDDSKVFCYFGCPWFAGTMTSEKKDADGNVYATGATKGNWGAVTGPTAYHWGGTYVSVGKDTPNPELCAFLLYELTCDPEIGVKITNQTGDCVNNKAANERLIAGELAADNPAAEFLGGQNPVEVWSASAESFNASNATYYDSTIKTIIDTASEAYNAGTYATVDDALSYIESECKSKLGVE